MTFSTSPISALADEQSMTLEQMIEARNALDEQIQRAKNEKRNKAIASIVDVIRAYDIDLNEIDQALKSASRNITSSDPTPPPKTTAQRFARNNAPATSGSTAQDGKRKRGRPRKVEKNISSTQVSEKNPPAQDLPPIARTVDREPLSPGVQADSPQPVMPVPSLESNLPATSPAPSEDLVMDAPPMLHTPHRPEQNLAQASIDATQPGAENPFATSLDEPPLVRAALEAQAASNEPTSHVAQNPSPSKPSEIITSNEDASNTPPEHTKKTPRELDEEFIARSNASLAENGPLPKPDRKPDH